MRKPRRLIPETAGWFFLRLRMLPVSVTTSVSASVSVGVAEFGDRGPGAGGRGPEFGPLLALRRV